MRPPNWTWEDGIGFLPFGDNPVPYDQDYFKRYQALADTERGRLITQMRVDMVCRWTGRREGPFAKTAPILDIGIGSGAFVSAMRSKGWDCYGKDVNPYAIEWLLERGWNWMSQGTACVLTFWDVMEHIPSPEVLLNHHQASLVFITMPIYEDEGHVFRSKHFKPGEHCWYFTRAGLLRYMKMWGYTCIERNANETTMGGREDIESFAFKIVG